MGENNITSPLLDPNTGTKIYTHYFDNNYTIRLPHEATWKLVTNISWDLIWMRPVGAVNTKGIDSTGKLILFTSDKDAIRYVHSVREAIKRK